jgi:hypothetical protein
MKAQTRHGAGEVTQQEFLISDTDLRINISGRAQPASVIFRNRNGEDEVVLLRGDKYSVINKKKMEQVQATMALLNQRMKGLPAQQAAALDKLGKDATGGPAPIEYTLNGADKVNGTACAKFTGKRGAEIVNTGCILQPGQAAFTQAHYQVFERMRNFFAGFRNSMANSPLAGVFAGASPAWRSMSDLADPSLKGFPVKVVAMSDGKEVSVFEIKSMETATLTADDFGTGKATESEMLMGPGARR